MRIKDVCAVLPLLLAAPTALAQSKAEKQAVALLSRPPAALKSLISVSGDEMDPEIRISTQNVTALKSKGLLSSTTLENSFLRAFIDKKTGAVKAQIYHIAIYSGRGWNSYNRATYETPEGINEVATLRANTDVQCGRYGCTYSEDVIVPVEFAVLETAASHYDAATPVSGLRYRLFAQSGERIDEAIPGNEIVAFVDVVKSALNDRRR